MWVENGGATGSQQSLSDAASTSSEPFTEGMEAPSDIMLTEAERRFLLYVQRGDVASVRRHLELYKDKPQELDKDCKDPLGRSSIAVAIENENLDLLECLLECNVKPKDSLLHAIAEEYVEGVEVLLAWEEKHHRRGQPYSWETMTRDTATFTKDITPLILAAHHNHYEILKLLLDRGASLPMPHDIRCGCDECLVSTEEDSLRHSLSRINSYKALASPSLIALSSKDPICTAFELSQELRRLQGVEHEFKTEYIELRQKVMKFASELLDQTRTRTELATMLNYDPNGYVWNEGEVNTLERLKMAIKYSQKSFVAHPNVQQLLGSIWYDGLPGFRRKDLVSRCIEVMKLAAMFPVLSLAYMFFPTSEKGKFLKKPFVKFITNCGSYMFFLMLLALASQRIEYLFIEWFGNAWLRSVLEEWKIKERGCFPGIVELGIIMYIFSLIWAEIKALWSDGILEYLSDLWNIIDFITNSFFMTWVLLRATSFLLVQLDLWRGRWPYYPREVWHPFDPMLLSEGCFGAAMIFSFLKLVHVFSVNPHLGPLQISLGRMIFDILKFFFLYTLVLFAFGCGLNQLMWYYAELEMQKCYSLAGGLPDLDNQEQACFIWRRWSNLFETSQSLFWASFGLVDLDAFELTGVGSFTRFWAMLMFGSYSMINVIVLLNLLIAMMSNSYNMISERSDTEWKFARSKLWLSYFEDGATVPPPFNMVPTPKGIMRALGLSSKHMRGSIKVKSKKLADQRHMNVMRLLVRRYITEQQRKADEKGVTEDDINEVKQDISTFRYELIDILKNNGMNTSMVNVEDASVIGKKGRAMERRLLKGFNIGIVEGIMTEILSSEKKTMNIFGKLARAMGKKKKEDWNAKVSRASMRRDQIGSSQNSLRRSQTSIKRRIQQENEILLKTLNPDKIIEYNPNLEIYSPTTRIAYAKFKVNTLKMEKAKKLAAEKKEEVLQKASAANQQLEAERGDAASKQFKSRSPTPQPPVKTPSPVPVSEIPTQTAAQTPEPPTSQAPRSSASQTPTPSPSKALGPPASQALSPPASQAVSTSESQAPKPPASQAPKPPASQAPKPPASQAPKQPASQAPRAPASQVPKLPASQAPKHPASQAPKPPSAHIPQPPSAPTNMLTGATPGKLTVPAVFQQQQGTPAQAPPRSSLQPLGPRRPPPPPQPIPSVPEKTTVKAIPPSPAVAAPPKSSSALPPRSSSPTTAASPSPASSRAPTPSIEEPFVSGKSSVTGQIRTGWL